MQEKRRRIGTHSIISSFKPHPHAKSITLHMQGELVEALGSHSAVYLFIYPWLEPCLYVLKSGWEPWLSVLQTGTLFFYVTLWFVDVCILVRD